MFGNMVSLSDYDGLNGFGTIRAQDLDELSKALEAGYQVVNQTGGSALRVESLEASLKVVTFTNAHIKLWKKIPKSPAYSTVEEYNQLSAYGAAGAFSFTREGELPQATDSTYTRRTQLVKFLGTTREITHPATLVHPAHGDVVSLEAQNGILYVLERVEDSLFHGDSSLAFDGEAEQWDGLDALIDPTQFIDLEGQPIQEADIEEAANQIVEAFGYPTDMFLGTRVMSDLVKTFYPRERIMLPAPVGGQVGHAVNTIATQAGVVQFNPDVFLRQLESPPAAATSANAPLTPQAPTSAVGALTTADWAKLLGTPAANTEFGYAVTACNRFGESAPVFIAANQALTPAQVAAGNNIDLQVLNAAVIGANPPEYMKIYRTRPLAAGAAVSANVNDYSLILKVPVLSQAAGVAAVTGAGGGRDLNFLIPFTQIAYMGELTPQVLTFRQLAPLMKMDLAVLAPAYRFMVLLYGTPILFAPQKFLRLVNIGQI